MADIVFKSGQITTSEKVKTYFEYLFQAEESGDPFPVDLDTVWPMAYTTKFNAKRALVEDEDFFEDVDYLLLKVEEQVSRAPGQGGAGLNKEKIFLSVQCLEFFIARKVRPIFEIYRQCRIEVTKAAKAKMSMPYHLRRYLANHDQVPFGYFSVLQEITAKLIAPLEMQGYTLPDRLVPDISVGQMFCRYLREKGLDTTTLKTYVHSYEDGRKVDSKLYPIELLSEFVGQFQQDWLMKRAERYFKDRDQSALAHLPRILNGPNPPARPDTPSSK